MFVGTTVTPPPFNPESLGYHAVALWDLTTGQRVCALKGHWDEVWSIAYSSDGRLIVSGGADKTIRLWEALSGQELNCRDFDAAVNYVTISPAGKKAAAARFKGSTFTAREWQSTVACFPIKRPTPGRPARPLEGSNLSDPWADLAADDAKQAYKAVQTRTEAAEASPKWLRERLRTVPRVPAADLARLIADLDADDFDRREAAAKELATVGAQAGPALRQALEETTSAEVRSGVQPLVKALDGWVVTDPDALRALRADWVLERIGTPQARAVLEDVAKGASEVRQTQEAKAALDFLGKRAAKP